VCTAEDIGGHWLHFSANRSRRRGLSYVFPETSYAPLRKNSS
jgi:hypothetical protein